jgi:phosphate transport system substrate-binding protein
VQTAGNAWRHGFVRGMLSATPLILACVGALFYSGGREELAASLTGSVQAVGSESMRPSVTACAEDFMTRNPQTDVIVKGGGSGDGVAALLHGIADVAMASRELSEREREYARSKEIELALFPLALDGVSIIVNRANPITDLSLAQLRELFSGRLRSWDELGSDQGEILLFARPPGSGTALMFGERVLGEEAYAASVRHLPTNEAIVAAVATQRGGIGYTDLGALKRGGDRIKPVALRLHSQSFAVTATPESVSSGHYPLSRRLILITAGAPLGTAKAFIDFCLSPSGQALLQSAGFITANPTLRRP